MAAPSRRSGRKSIRDAADVRVDGEPLPRSRLRLLHASTSRSASSRRPAIPTGRPRVIDLAPDGQRLFMVGRLDVSSEGLDPGHQRRRAGQSAGASALRRRENVSSASRRAAEPEVLERLRRGVHLAEGWPTPSGSGSRASTSKARSWRWCSTKGRTAKFAACWLKSGHKVLHLRPHRARPVAAGRTAARRMPAAAARRGRMPCGKRPSAGVRRPGVRGQGAAGSRGRARARSRRGDERGHGEERTRLARNHGRCQHDPSRQRTTRGRRLAARAAAGIGEARAARQRCRRPTAERATPEPRRRRGGTVIGGESPALAAGRRGFQPARERAPMAGHAKVSNRPAEAVQDRREQRR